MYMVAAQTVCHNEHLVCFVVYVHTLHQLVFHVYPYRTVNIAASNDFHQKDVVERCSVYRDSGLGAHSVSVRVAAAPAVTVQSDH